MRTQDATSEWVQFAEETRLRIIPRDAVVALPKGLKGTQFFRFVKGRGSQDATFESVLDATSQASHAASS